MNEIYNLDTDSDVLLSQFGVNNSTVYAKHAMSHIRTMSKQAPVIPAGNFSLRHGDDYYVALDKKRLIKITANGITVVPNAGQVYVTLSGEPWDYTPSNDGVSYLVEFIESILPMVSSNPRFIVATLIALMLDANVPLMLITSEPGAGKTTFTNCILKLLFGSMGSASRIPTKEQDLVTAFNAKRAIGLDNLEVVQESILDLLCTVVTGGTITHRKLYTDRETVDLVIRNLVMVTAVDASPLYRADVLDRMLAINFERASNRISESVLYAKVLDQRNRLLSAFVQVAQITLTIPRSPTPKHRLTEWYHVGTVCGLVDADFDILRTENQERTLERLPLLDAIQLYCQNGGLAYTSGVEFHAALQGVLSRTLNFALLRQLPDSWRKMARIIRQHEQLFRSQCNLSLKSQGANVVLEWGVSLPVPPASPI